MSPFRTFVFLAATALVLTPLNANAETCPYQEKDGQVVIEIEAESPNGDWTKKTSVSGYKGSGYFEWTGPNYFGEPGNGTLRYKIKINSPGKYQFLWRTQIMIGDDPREHNDSWLRMSGEPASGEVSIKKNTWRKVYMGDRDGWSWQARTNDREDPVRQYFSAGEHTIEISGRSKGHAIDRFILFKYEDKPYLNGADKPGKPTDTQESNLTNQSASSCNGGGTTTTTKPSTTTTKPSTTTTKPTTTTTKPTTTTTKPTTTTTKPTTTTTKPTTTTTKPTTTTTKPTTTTTSTTTTTVPVSTTVTSTTSTTLAPEVPGDVNGDGDVTVRDALETLMAAVGGGECALCVCDYNGDGEVTVADGFAILFLAVGRDVEAKLPPCS